MERAYVENDPTSAPHLVLTSAQPNFQSSSVHPPAINDDKYFNPEANGQASWPVSFAPPYPQTDQPISTAPKKKKRWMWILIGLAVAVIVVVAGVVGGVVGSQAAKTNNDGQKSTSTGSNVTESDDTPSTATSTDTPTVTVTAQTQTPTSSNDSDTLARFYMFGLGNCDGSSDTYNVTTAGNMCYPVPSNKRSIFVSKNSDCIISTRSGTDCGGKSFTVPDTGECHGVLYAAVSVVC